MKKRISDIYILKNNEEWMRNKYENNHIIVITDDGILIGDILKNEDSEWELYDNQNNYLDGYEDLNDETLLNVFRLAEI